MNPSSTNTPSSSPAPSANPAEVTTLPPAGSDPLLPAAGELIHLPGYEILRELGRGGMGVVYQARHIQLNRIVALKMILSGACAGAADLARFRTEAEAIARLQHPHIVQIFEISEYDGKPYISLEYCGGGSLEKRLDGQPLPIRDAVTLVEKLARAVQHAHDRGILHRDLKPGNVLLTGTPETPLAECEPRITDFGLAKLIGEGVGRTVSGAVLGTPSYMAPEQAGGHSGAVGPAADVYALGVLLYELLTGRPPFRGPSALDTLMQVVSDEVPPPRQLCPAIGRDLEVVVLKCLEKEPQRRYPSAAALADDLGRYLRGEPVQARPPGLFGRVRRWANKKPALAATLCALSLFYGNHLLLLSLGKTEGGAWHWFATSLVACWALGAVGFQWLRDRPGLHWPATYGWAALDVVMFALLLLRGGGPQSALLVCYPLLIAGAALRFRAGLVWFVTALCSASYAILLLDARLRRPELLVEVPTAVISLLSQIVMGVLMALLLRRFRQELAREATRQLRDPTEAL
jgi:hypothetical protein